MKKMKKYWKALLLLPLATAISMFSACTENDPEPEPVDETKPTVTINAPTAGAIAVAGSQLIVSATIGDDTEIAKVTVSLGNGTVTVATEEITEFTSPTTFSYSKNIGVPANVVLGAHTLTFTVEDESGNTETASVAIEAYPVYEDGKTTVMIVAAPDDVTDYSGDNTIYMVGENQEPVWDVASGSDPMTAYTDSQGKKTYYRQVANTGIGGFKFVRGLDWLYGEKDENGKELSNRSIEANAKKVELTVGSWRDYNPEVENWDGGNYFFGTGFTKHTIRGKIYPGATSQSPIATATYTIVDEAGATVSSGAITINDDDTYSVDVEIADYEQGAYNIIVSATAEDGNSGREDKALNIVEFPCDGSGLAAVDATKTRLIARVPATTDDLYITGKIMGADIWGSNLADVAYKMTKMSDGCYYIDVTLQAGDMVQVIRTNAGYADWWRGQATNTVNSDATANFNVNAASSGTTEFLYYQYWREEPAN